jgi:hypothetical protein
MFRHFSKLNKARLNTGNFQKRFNSFSSSAKSGQLTAILGGVGIVGGGILLLNSLNKPIVDKSGYASSNENNQMIAERERNSIPKHVQEYLFNTYKYVASGLTITSLSAYLAYKSGMAMRLMQLNPWVSGLGLLAASFGTMIWTRSTDPSNVIAKNIAYSSFNAVIGLSLCGLAFLNPQILLR